MRELNLVIATCLVHNFHKFIITPVHIICHSKYINAIIGINQYIIVFLHGLHSYLLVHDSVEIRNNDIACVTVKLLFSRWQVPPQVKK